MQLEREFGSTEAEAEAEADREALDEPLSSSAALSLSPPRPSRLYPREAWDEQVRSRVSCPVRLTLALRLCASGC